MAFDAFLKLDGIKGESRDSKHKDEIEIESFSWGLANAGGLAGGGGSGAGRATFRDLSFTTSVSKATPSLFLSCASGKHIKEGLLTLRKAGSEQLEYLKIKLQDILVTSVVEGGSTAGETPMDEIALNFGEIEITYTEQNPNGSAGSQFSAGWNLRENKA